MSLVRIKDISHSVRRGLSPNYSDDGVAILNQSCIRGDVIDFTKSKLFNNPSDRGLVSKGDSLINSTGTGTLGRVSIYNEDEKGFVDSHITKVSPDKRLVCPDYLHLFLMQDEINRYFNVMSEGATNQIELSRKTVDLLALDLPSLDKQKVTASLVKLKTSALSKSIFTLKQKLLRLDEYKTALIHNAVTKGLDAKGCRILDGTPAAEMTWKPSGVEWLGDVPDGWGVFKLKDFVSYESGKRKTPEKNETEVISLGGEHVNPDGTITPKKNKAIGVGFYNQMNSGHVKVNDVLMVKDGATTGKIGFVSEMNEPMAINEHLFILRSQKVSPRYLCHLLTSKSTRQQVNLSIASNIIPGLNSLGLESVLFSLPSDVNELEALETYLTNKCESILITQNNINQKIALLVEYKKSLINEAVSGEFGTENSKKRICNDK